MTGTEHCEWSHPETWLVNLKVLMKCGCLDHKDCVVSIFEEHAACVIMEITYFFTAVKTSGSIVNLISVCF